MSATTQRPDDDKMKELILYVSRKSGGDEKFGATKLNKILFYSDFLAYLQFGEPITGQEYQKLKRGPAPRRLVPLRNELEASGRLTVVKQKYHTGTQKKPIALEEPDLSGFDPREVSLVDSVIEQLWNMDAAHVSKYSHKFIGWKLADISEVIPYESALLSVRELSPEEVERGLQYEELAKECLTH